MWEFYPFGKFPLHCTLLSSLRVNHELSLIFEIWFANGTWIFEWLAREKLNLAMCSFTGGKMQH